MTATKISATEVKELRDRTGAGMMDAKQALVGADGDMEKAVELLRVKMGSRVGKLAGREAAEGTVQSYIHAGGKVGVLVEVDCNTDFVALNDDFVAFAREVAVHLAGSPETRWITDDEVSAELQQAEQRVYEQQAEAEGKPEEIRAKIVEGKLAKWLDGVVLLRQSHVNPAHEEKTIEEMRAELSAKTGENVVIRRFARFKVGDE